MTSLEDCFPALGRQIMSLAKYFPALGRVMMSLAKCFFFRGLNTTYDVTGRLLSVCLQDAVQLPALLYFQLLENAKQSSKQQQFWSDFRLFLRTVLGKKTASKMHNCWGTRFR